MKKKQQMLEELGNMQIAKKVMDEAKENKTENPIDTKYYPCQSFQGSFWTNQEIHQKYTCPNT